MTTHQVLSNPRLAILALVAMRSLTPQTLHDPELMDVLWLDYQEVCRRQRLVPMPCRVHTLTLALQELQRRYPKRISRSITVDRFFT